MSRERQIAVERSNYNVRDSEFDSMRERFESEMRRVEDEMARLRREFEGYTPKLSPPPAFANGHSNLSPNNYSTRRSESGFSEKKWKSSSSLNESRNETRNEMSSYNNGGNFGSGFGNTGSLLPHSTMPRYDPQLDAIKSPLIRDESDGKTLRLRFDVSHYAPEEVTVKTVDNRLLVHAKHEEKSPQRTVYREYNQEFMLPRGTNPEWIRSSLSVDGVLTVEAPLPTTSGAPPPAITHPIQTSHSPRLSHRGFY